MLVDTFALNAVDYAIAHRLALVDYMVGLKYSYAVVSGPRGRAMGVAYMPAEDLSKGTASTPEIEDLASMVKSMNIQSRSLGVAIINAISQYKLWLDENPPDVMYDNILDCIPRCCPLGRVVVIGNMVPLVRKLREVAREVIVLERNPRLRMGAEPDFLAPRVLRDADAAIITGAALINDTLDSLIAMASGKVFLVGPTAGIYPPWLEGYVDAVAGSRIEDIESVRDIIRRGGGRWDFASHTREYIFTFNGR